MQKFLAVIGGFVLLVILVGCGFLGALAVNANQAAIRLNEFPVTLRAIDPPAQDAPQIPPTPRVEVETVVIEVTAVPLPTNPPLPTVVFATSQPTPAPTRPAIELLPDGEGPYTPAQMQICRDVWAQSLQAELNVKQFGYCLGVIDRGQ